MIAPELAAALTLLRKIRKVERDEVLSGDQELDCDLVVGAGARLILAPGCRLDGAAGGRPPRIFVYGALEARGTPRAPVQLGLRRSFGALLVHERATASLTETFARCLSAREAAADVEPGGRLSWRGGGIEPARIGVKLSGGTALLENVEVRGGEQGILLEGGWLRARGCRLAGQRDFCVGVQGEGARAALRACRLEGARTGVFARSGRAELEGCVLRGHADAALDATGGELAARGGSVEACAVGVRASAGRAFVRAAALRGCACGVHALGSGRVELQGCRVLGGEFGLRVTGGELLCEDTLLRGARSGARAAGGRLEARRTRWREHRDQAVEVLSGACAALEDCEASDCGIGIVACAAKLALRGVELGGSSRLGVGLSQGATLHWQGGSVSGASCALEASASSSACLRGVEARSCLKGVVLSNGSSLDWEEGRVAGGDCAIELSGSSARLKAFAASRCGQGALARGSRLSWEKGAVEDCGLALDLASSECDLAQLAVSRCGVGARAQGGRLAADDCRFESVAGPALDAGQGAFAAARRCAFERCGCGVEARAAHVHVEQGRFSGCARGVVEREGGRVCARSVSRLPERRRPKEALRALVLGTKDLAPARALYKAAYALAARVVGRWARRERSVRCAWLYRGATTGDWVPGVSDLDFVVLADSLRGTPGLARLEAFWERYARWKKLFPFLGEALLLEPADGELYVRWGGARAGEFGAGRPLAGVPPAPRPRPMGAPAALTECAHAFTRLGQTCLSGARDPWALCARQLFKSAADVLRYGQASVSGRPAPPRAETPALLAAWGLEEWRPLLEAVGARAPEPRPGDKERLLARFYAASVRRLDALAAAALSSASGPKAGWTRRVPARRAEDAEQRRDKLDVVESWRHAFDGALCSAVVDDLYRSWAAVDEALVRCAAFETRLEAWLATVRLSDAALPLVVTPAFFDALQWLAYLDSPTRALDRPEGGGLSCAGPAAPGHWQLHWGRAAAEPDDALARACARESWASFRSGWRLLGSAEGRVDARSTRHYLTTRALGLRLLLERGVAASLYDSRGLLDVYAEHFPERAQAARSAVCGREPDAFAAVYAFVDEETRLCRPREEAA